MAFPPSNQPPRRLSRAGILALLRSHRRLRWILPLALAATAVVVLGSFLATGVLAAQRARGQAEQLQDALGQIQVAQLGEPATYERLLELSAQVEDALASARGRSWAFAPVRWLPFFGPRLGEATDVLHMGFYFTQAARLTLDGLSGAAAALQTMEGAQAAETIDAILSRSQPQFAEARQALDRAGEFRQRLAEPLRWAGLTQRFVGLFDRYAPTIEAGLFVVTETPDALPRGLLLQTQLRELQELVADPLTVVGRPEDVQALLDGMSEHVDPLETALVRLQGELASTDGAGSEKSQTQRLVDLAAEGTSLLRQVIESARPLVNIAQIAFQEGLFTAGFGEAVGLELDGALESVENARIERERVSELLSQTLDETGLRTTLPTAVGAFSGSLERLETGLNREANGIKLLRYGLGYDAPREFIVLAENNDEIRAGGGFIGIVVQMSLDQGVLQELTYLDSVDVDADPFTNPPAPIPIYRYLWIASLLFRDANWNPHFPAAAVDLADLYQRGQGQQVDGVVAATEEMALDMVEALGTVRVPGVAGALDRDAAEGYVEGGDLYTCLPRHASRRAKRCFDEDLIQSLLDRLMGSLSPQERTRVVQVLVDSLQAKRLLIHIFNPEASALIWEQGWNGAVRQVDHDYLMLVDSSFPGHVFSSVERSIEYRVSLVPGQDLESRLSLRYLHTAPPTGQTCRQTIAPRQGCYWNFFRVFIPVLATDVVAPPVPVHEGSQLLVWGYPDPDSLEIINTTGAGLTSLTEIGGYLTVSPGTQVVVPIRYRLPGNMLRQVAPGVYQYRLLIQKQAGTLSERVTVFVELPPGGKLVDASPAPAGRLGQWLRFDMRLEADQTLAVSFTGGSAS